MGRDGLNWLGDQIPMDRTVHHHPALLPLLTYRHLHLPQLIRFILSKGQDSDSRHPDRLRDHSNKQNRGH
ncbi:MAG: hypothetical protein JWN34_2062 [Bryobacterales bacterium]|nr:hypothetical protein [Bryobacterales bacterium]